MGVDPAEYWANTPQMAMMLNEFPMMLQFNRSIFLSDGNIDDDSGRAGATIAQGSKLSADETAQVLSRLPDLVQKKDRIRLAADRLGRSVSVDRLIATPLKTATRFCCWRKADWSTLAAQRVTRVS